MLQSNQQEFVMPWVSDRIHRTHNKCSIRQARKISDAFDISNFTWRKQVEGITIDSLASPDLDDGIHIEKLNDKKGWRLFISIASPTEIIEPWSHIEQEWIDRATSVYFWESHIYHMLPNVISTDIASLNHNTHRPTLTLELEINEDFEVINKDMYQSLFHNRQRHDPWSFTRWITNTADSEYEYFSLMHELARWLRQRRENEMRIDTFDDADRRITMGEKIYGYSNTHISSFVIQEFMLLANMQVAQMMVQESVNGVFRFHMPEYERVKDLPTRLDRAEYSPEPLFHRWLWVWPYMHFTSPIRRIADYISHRQLICLLEWREEHYTSQQVEELCRYINLQLTATLSNQREELLDMHGKRIIRKWKKAWDGLFSSMKDHIKQRQENGLRTPKSIRDEVVRQIHEKWKVEDWVIRKFLLSGEQDILENMRDMIVADHSTRKYINIFSSIPGINFTETQFMHRGILYYRVHGNVNGDKFTCSSKISWDYETPTTQKKWDPKKRRVVEIWEDSYGTTIEQLRRAKVYALKKAIIRTFDIIL